ncbi:MAG: sugar ABC transporter ATP-binding protein [Chloroflexi bacterium]|nr:sugar ABC transporter ATP-binding protein [Chloroflexota bacterium]
MPPTHAPNPPALLEMRHITKQFPGVLALDDVSLEVRRGEVHAIVGENGAGKSTLMKILSGVYQADTGEVIFNGEHVHFTNPRQAQSAGITTIYQELNQIPLLSVMENIFLGSELTRGPFIDWPAIRQQSQAVLTKLRLDIDPRMQLSRLGVGQAQMVEVAKALHHEADLIIMDEPTAALSLHEIENLFEIIRDLRAQGVAVIYISHHLEEAFAICDRITVLRDGQHISTQPVGDLDMDELIRLMVGRTLDEQFPKVVAERGAEILRVEGLNQGERLKDISLAVHAGEVLGIAGLMGAGRTEIVRAVFGADPIDSGVVFIDGERVAIRSPRDAIRHGIALLTEDRKQQGLLMHLPTRANVSVAILQQLTRWGLINRRQERDLVNRYVESIAIKVADLEQLVSNLSGGNQQKVVLSKWMATTPRVLIFDEPTRGIDVGAKVEIYKLINTFVAQGGAVIMVSSELPEILGMSDRIMVIREGRVTGFVERADATQERLMELATAATDEQADFHLHDLPLHDTATPEQQ